MCVEGETRPCIDPRTGCPTFAVCNRTADGTTTLTCGCSTCDHLLPPDTCAWVFDPPVGVALPSFGSDGAVKWVSVHTIETDDARTEVPPTRSDEDCTTDGGWYYSRQDDMPSIQLCDASCAEHEAGRTFVLHAECIAYM